MLTLVASALEGGDSIGRLRRVAHRGNRPDPEDCVVKTRSTLGTFLRSLGIGPRPPDWIEVSRELLARAWSAGCRTRRRAIHHRPGFDVLRDIRSGQGGGARPRLHGQEGLSPAVGRGRWHRRRADGPAARGPGQHRSGRRPLPAGDGGAGALRRGQGTTHGCGPTAASTPTPSSPPAAGWMSASPSPSARVLARSVSSRPYPSRTGRPSPTGWTAPPTLAETSYNSLPEQARRRAGAAHRPARAAHVRFPVGPLRHTAITASSSDRGGGNPGTGGRPSAPRRDRERHPRPQVRRGVEPSPLGPLPRQRRLAGGAGYRPQPGSRWTARIGLGEQIVTTKTLRRRFFSMAGRLTRSARRLTLHLPQRCPGKPQFSGALARFRALPLPS